MLLSRTAFTVGLGVLLVWTGVVSIRRDEIGAVIGSVLLLAGVAFFGVAAAGVLAGLAQRTGRLTLVPARSERFGHDGTGVPGIRTGGVAAGTAGAVAVTAALLFLAPGRAWTVACAGLVCSAGLLAAAVRRTRRGEALVLVPAGVEYRSPSGTVAVAWEAVDSIIGHAPYRKRLVAVYAHAPAARRRGPGDAWVDEDVPAWGGGLPLPVDRLDADPARVLGLLRRAHADPVLRARLGDVEPGSERL